MSDIVELLGKEAVKLAHVEPSVPATTLVVLPDDMPYTRSFSLFMSTLLPKANTQVSGLTHGSIQVVPFHPNATYGDDEDAYNYATRSPYPMLHLLRESDLEIATPELVNRFQNTESFKRRNARYLRAVGISRIRNVLERLPEPSTNAVAAMATLKFSDEDEWSPAKQLRFWLIDRSKREEKSEIILKRLGIVNVGLLSN